VSSIKFGQILAKKTHFCYFKEHSHWISHSSKNARMAKKILKTPLHWLMHPISKMDLFLVREQCNANCSVALYTKATLKKLFIPSASLFSLYPFFSLNFVVPPASLWLSRLPQKILQAQKIFLGTTRRKSRECIHLQKKKKKRAESAVSWGRREERKKNVHLKKLIVKKLQSL
jgi:hypothetical protein